MFLLNIFYENNASEIAKVKIPKEIEKTNWEKWSQNINWKKLSNKQKIIPIFVGSVVGTLFIIGITNLIGKKKVSEDIKETPPLILLDTKEIEKIFVFKEKDKLNELVIRINKDLVKNIDNLKKIIEEMIEKAEKLIIKYNIFDELDTNYYNKINVNLRGILLNAASEINKKQATELKNKEIILDLEYENKKKEIELNSEQERKKSIEKSEKKYREKEKRDGKAVYRIQNNFRELDNSNIDQRGQIIGSLLFNKGSNYYYQKQSEFSHLETIDESIDDIINNLELKIRDDSDRVKYESFYNKIKNSNMSTYCKKYFIKLLIYFYESLVMEKTSLKEEIQKLEESKKRKS